MGWREMGSVFNMMVLRLPGMDQYGFLRVNPSILPFLGTHKQEQNYAFIQGHA